MKLTLIANRIHFNDTRSINFKDEEGNTYFWSTRSRKFDNPNVYIIGKQYNIKFKISETDGNFNEIKNVKEVK